MVPNPQLTQSLDRSSLDDRRLELGPLPPAESLAKGNEAVLEPLATFKVPPGAGSEDKNLINHVNRDMRDFVVRANVMYATTQNILHTIYGTETVRDPIVRHLVERGVENSFEFQVARLEEYAPCESNAAESIDLVQRELNKASKGALAEFGAVGAVLHIVLQRVRDGLWEFNDRTLRYYGKFLAQRNSYGDATPSASALQEFDNEVLDKLADLSAGYDNLNEFIVLKAKEISCPRPVPQSSTILSQ